jgi:hypothetical protein
MDNKSLDTLMVEAKQIITDLELPSQMLAKTQVYVFLILLGMTPNMNWDQASNPSCGITPIMKKIQELGWATYEPNTRETIRDECVGVLVDACLVTPNPDDPTRAKNSPNYCYQINSEVLGLIQSFDTDQYRENLADFHRKYKSLKVRYAAERKSNRLPVTLPSGQTTTLSPGGQNPLIVKIIEEFAPQYYFDKVLYIGDTEKRDGLIDQDSRNILESINIKIENLLNNDAVPDVILYRSNKNVLAIIEAVKTGGEINVERRDKLLKLFEDCTAKLSFINAFESFNELKKLLKNDITWETHAWLADNPTHMIHFNGDKYWIADEKGV